MLTPRSSPIPRLLVVACWLVGAAAAVAGDAPPVEVILGVIGRPEPSWWTLAFEERAAADLGDRPAATAADTVPWALLGSTGLPAALEIVLAVPDSLSSARLWELGEEEALGLSPLRDFFHAVSRGRAFEDLRSREAAMFGEFVHESIMVPNPEDD